MAIKLAMGNRQLAKLIVQQGKTGQKPKQELK
jgi:hypothetical protein